MLLAVFVATMWSLDLLLRCWKWTGGRAQSFEEVAHAVLGPRGDLVVRVCVALQNTGE